MHVRALVPALALLTVSALADDPSDEAGEDLATMAERYGWGVVASVVATADQGDQTAADVHRKLEAMGLARLEVPVRDTAGLGATHLQGCGWNGGVVCPLPLPPGAPDEAGLSVHCDLEGMPIALRAVASPEPTAETSGTAWIEGLERCWRAGAPGIRVAPRTATSAPPLIATSGGTLPTSVIQAITAENEALAACGPGVTTLFLDEAGAVTRAVATAAGEPSLPLAQCVAAVLGEVAVEGRAGLPDLTIQTPVRTPGPGTE